MISNYKSSLELESNFSGIEPTKIDVSFLPESGNLVENAINRVAFKAVDETGKKIRFNSVY